MRAAHAWAVLTVRCPSCAAERDRVVDSRPAEDGAAIRRRRECLACGERFSTYERVERAALAVRKRDGSVQPFDPDRILRGIRRAAANLDLPDADLTRAATRVEARVRARGARTVGTDQIGIEVLDVLRDLNHVAYVRFASVYKGFTSPDDFVRELATLEKADVPEPPRAG